MQSFHPEEGFTDRGNNICLIGHHLHLPTVRAEFLKIHSHTNPSTTGLLVHWSSLANPQVSSQTAQHRARLFSLGPLGSNRGIFVKKCELGAVESLSLFQEGVKLPRQRFGIFLFSVSWIVDSTTFCIFYESGRHQLNLCGSLEPTSQIGGGPRKDLSKCKLCEI